MSKRGLFRHLCTISDSKCPNVNLFLPVRQPVHTTDCQHIFSYSSCFMTLMHMRKSDMLVAFTKKKKNHKSTLSMSFRTCFAALFGYKGEHVIRLT